MSAFPYYATAPVPVPPPHQVPSITSFGFRHFLVFGIVIAFLWYLGRVLGAFGMSTQGSQVTVAVALLISALMTQILTKAPHILGQFETFSIFTLTLVASLATVFHVHYTTHGWSL